MPINEPSITEEAMGSDLYEKDLPSGPPHRPKQFAEPQRPASKPRPPSTGKMSPRRSPRWADPNTVPGSISL